MDIHARSDLWTDHDGQSIVMDYDAVERELNRLEAEIERLLARNSEHEARYDALEAKEEHHRRDAERLRTALTTVQTFIKGEQIAHALVPEGNGGPDTWPSLEQVIVRALEQKEDEKA